MITLAYSRAARTALGACAIASLLATPAAAGIDDYPYPTAVAADAADVMARYGGVVIDVESRFAAPAIDYFGCGVVKHETKTPVEKRTFDYTSCAIRSVKVPDPPSGNKPRQP